MAQQKKGGRKGSHSYHSLIKRGEMRKEKKSFPSACMPFQGQKKKGVSSRKTEEKLRPVKGGGGKSQESHAMKEKLIGKRRKARLGKEI